MRFNCILKINNYCTDCKIIPNKKMFYIWLWRIYIFFNIKKKINIFLINKKEILNLNFKFKNRNYSTDILSFKVSKYLKGISDIFLGDIFISPCKVWYNSCISKINYYYYFSYLSIHGLLHILGFKHNTFNNYKNMRAMELFFLCKLKKNICI